MQKKTSISKCLLAGTFAIVATMFTVGAANCATDTHRSLPGPELATVSIGGLQLAPREPILETPAIVVLSDVAEYDHLLDAALEIGNDLDIVYPGIDPIETGAIVAGVFNSMAIPIHSFPVAKRWMRIMHGIEGCAGAGTCRADSTLLDRIAHETGGKTLVEKVGIVNTLVNSTIRYRSDRSLYGKLDYWAAPEEILSRSSGDCEDFAILKMTALMRAGLPANSLSLVVLRDTDRGVFHAVLAVATSSGSFILDNTRAKVVKDSDLPNYQPLYSLSQARAWVHGTKAKNKRALASNGEVTTAAPGEGIAPNEAENLLIGRAGSLRPGLPALQ
jgi:predicted transglutaminase-like cysteine proteinase